MTLKSLPPVKLAYRAGYQGKQLVAAVINHHGRRREILRGYAYSQVLRRFTENVSVRSGDMTVLVRTADYFVGKNLFSRGPDEDKVFRLALDLIGAGTPGADPLRGRTFVDVGANIGTTTLLALTKYGAAQSICFEPDASNLRLLRCNLQLNGVEDRARIFDCALSDRSSILELELSNDNSGDHRIRVATSSDPVDMFDESARKTVRIRSVRFDELAVEENIDLADVGVFWVDAQGHEAHILGGASSIVQSDTPVVIEYWPYGLRRAEALDQLHELIASNYRIAVDLGRTLKTGQRSEVPAKAVHTLAPTYPRGGFTDLLLLK